MNTPPQTDPDGQAAWLRHYEEVARQRSGIEHRPRSLSSRLREKQRPIAVATATLFLAGSILLAALVL